MTREYPKQPLIGVGVVVFRGTDVLLVKRGKPPRMGQWSLPGGLQELGETVSEAGAREVREEAGVEVAVRGLIEVLDSIQKDADARVRFHYTLIDLYAEWQSGEPRAGDDAADAAWFSPGELDSLPLWSETRRIIARARQLHRSEGP